MSRAGALLTFTITWLAWDRSETVEEVQTYDLTEAIQVAARRLKKKDAQGFFVERKGGGEDVQASGG